MSMICYNNIFYLFLHREIKGKVYNAYVKEKEEAKKTYDDAVSEGRGAAHIEQK